MRAFRIVNQNDDKRKVPFLSYLNPGKSRAGALHMRLVAPDCIAHGAVVVPLRAVPGQATLLAMD